MKWFVKLLAPAAKCAAVLGVLLGGSQAADAAALTGEATVSYIQPGGDYVESYGGGGQYA